MRVIPSADKVKVLSFIIKQLKLFVLWLGRSLIVIVIVSFKTVLLPFLIHQRH